MDVLWKVRTCPRMEHLRESSVELIKCVHSNRGNTIFIIVCLDIYHCVFI